MQPIIHRCAWCGARFAPNPGPGRPRRYCKRSHRQRHYEAALTAARHQLGADDVLLRRADLEELRDRLYILESGLADARNDLAEAGTIEAYPAVFSDLAAAIEQMISLRLEPRAVGLET